MGIVRILEGVVMIIHRQQNSPETIKLYWPHGLLTLTILMTMIVFWWNAFNLNQTGIYTKEVWAIWEYALYILPCLMLFLIGDLLFPNDLEQSREVCIKDFYFKQHREVFLFITVYGLITFVNANIFFLQPLDATSTLWLLSIVSITLPMAIWKNQYLHCVLNVFFFINSIFIATFNWQLG